MEREEKGRYRVKEATYQQKRGKKEEEREKKSK